MRVRLERPSARREEEFIAAVHRSADLHAGLAALPSTSQSFRIYLERYAQPTHDGSFVVMRGSDELVGIVNFNEIVRGNLQSAHLGYAVFAPHERRGLMGEALRLALRRAFGELRLHRVEANVQPENEPSIRLVRGIGFRREGLSPRYLRISDRWCDHERWALLADEPVALRLLHAAAPLR